MAIAPVLKTGGRKPLGVRIPRSPQMPFHVYLLWSHSCRRTYVAQCEVVEKRVREHNAGKTFATRRCRPWRVVYQEEYQTRQEALRRERWYKTDGGRSHIAVLLEQMGLGVRSPRSADSESS